ncbi:MAG TPA: hypothetical protein GX708_09250 [Gallicola sp.]|nr:hypothetical protein [Gallicola sp.]
MANWSLYESKMNIEGSSTRERQINAIQENILNDFQNSPSYRQTYINGSNNYKEIHVVETQYSFVKNILTKPGDELFAGDILEFDGSKWLCTEVNKSLRVYDIGKVYLCNNTLKLYKNHILYEIPCTIDSNVRLYSMGYEDNKYFSVPDSSIIVRIPNNSITQDIARDQIYNFSGDNYKIVDINKVIENGLIVLKMEYSPKEQQLPNYTIRILNGLEIDLQQSTTLQLDVNVYDNDTLISPTPPLIFSSSDDSLCTVDSNGLVTALDIIDNCTITVSLASDIDISQTININVIEMPQDNLTVDIIGSNSIVKNYTSNYSCVFKNNGIEYADTSIFYLRADDGISPTTLAEIVAQDGNVNTCIVKGNNLGYVRLFVKNISETVVGNGLRIQIKNLF